MEILELEAVVGIRVKNARAEKLAREVAAETGETLTEAIIHSLEERLERLQSRRSDPDLPETLMAIGRRCSSLPDLDTREADEILGYDETGDSNAQTAINEDASARLSEGWQSFWRILSSQDLTDKSKWSEPIDDPDEYFRTVFGV